MILKEFYNTGDGIGASCHSVYWLAQTFTPSDGHTITPVKLKLSRDGLPGTLTVGIKSTDGEGKPTGPDLCLGYTDGNNFVTSSSGAWYTISLGEGSFLSKDIKYAIVIRASSGDSSNKVLWRFDAFGTYVGGNLLNSSNSGSSWTSWSGRDHMFEEYVTPTIDDVYTIVSEINSKLPEPITG